MDKINSEISKIVSNILCTTYAESIFFPSINFVITDSDLERSKIFISFPTDNQMLEFKKVLRAQRDIQHQFASRIKLRKTPILEFVLDEKLDQITKVEEIIDQLPKKHEN